MVNDTLDVVDGDLAEPADLVLPRRIYQVKLQHKPGQHFVQVAELLVSHDATKGVHLLLQVHQFQVDLAD